MGYFIFTVFLKKKVKEHAGAGGSAPALPPGFGDAPPAAPGLPAGRRGVSCLPAWVTGAGYPPGPSRMHPCQLDAEKLLGLPRTQGRDGCVRRMLQLPLLPKGLCTLFKKNTQTIK